MSPEGPPKPEIAANDNHVFETPFSATAFDRTIREKLNTFRTEQGPRSFPLPAVEVTDPLVDGFVIAFERPLPPKERLEGSVVYEKRSADQAFSVAYVLGQACPTILVAVKDLLPGDWNQESDAAADSAIFRRGDDLILVKTIVSSTTGEDGPIIEVTFQKLTE